jgi:hypothetical protein
VSEQARIEALLNDIKAGKVPWEMQVMAAKGLLPFPQNQVLPLLIVFLGGQDGELKTLARKTISEYPQLLLQAYIASSAGTSELDVLTHVVEDPDLQESIALSKKVGNDTLEHMASGAHDRLQEIIISNQERILANPRILDALTSNPHLTPNVQRRILEVKEEFFGEKKPFTPSISDEEAKDMGITPTQYMDLFESFHLENLTEDQLFSTIQIPQEEVTEEQYTLLQQMYRMSVPEKIQVALKGSQEARGVLVHDSNKLVKEAVVKSPKVTEPEIVNIASNRSSDEEVLRYLGTSRKWVRKYPVIRQLVFNPKTPVGVSMGLLPRMTKKDLKDLSGEKNVPDPIRQAAGRLYLVRMAQ